MVAKHCSQFFDGFIPLAAVEQDTVSEVMIVFFASAIASDKLDFAIFTAELFHLPDSQTHLRRG